MRLSSRFCLRLCFSFHFYFCPSFGLWLWLWLWLGPRLSLREQRAGRLADERSTRAALVTWRTSGAGPTCVRSINKGLIIALGPGARGGGGGARAARGARGVERRPSVRALERAKSCRRCCDVVVVLLLLLMLACCPRCCVVGPPAKLAPATIQLGARPNCTRVLPAPAGTTKLASCSLAKRVD